MPTIHPDAALQRLMHLLPIPGKSCEEEAIAKAVVQMLHDAGLPANAIRFDDAHTRTPQRGQVGNLIVTLPGTIQGPRRWLSAHLDTVPICVGCKPTRDGDRIVSSDPSTGLGGDNRAGVAVLITALLELLRSKSPHPPLTFCWFVQEEIGLQGSRCMDSKPIGPIERAYNFDGGVPEKLTIGATGGERMEIGIEGYAAHAGIAPESGLNAITLAAHAIHWLSTNGWLGKIQRGDIVGTSNIGVIEGGEATNVVTPSCCLRAEARSHQATARTQIVAAIRGAFQTAVEQIRSQDATRGGRLQFTSRVDYESFRLQEDHPSVRGARQAVAKTNRTPSTAISNGGLDANWLFVHGIHAVSLGCGQRDVHTANETLDIPDYLTACQIALNLCIDP
jgi:tripeptide aminopeptidase